MAIYHLSGTLISRSQGRSAVASAAYRSGERLTDERYQKVHDYTKRQDVAHREILTPEGAPAWMQNREKLWNFVEAFEKRKDAQLAREFNFSLPKELTIKQNLELTRAFVKRAFVDRGMVVDMAIHVDTKEDGLYPHAHVMLTTRVIEGDGFGPKARVWNDKALLLEWRALWGEMANHHLALNGHDLQIDHRTLMEQGIPLEPQHKIGPAVVQGQLARLADHQRIARENGERLLLEPGIALDVLTQQQSTFTHQDLARFVNRHTLDAEQFAAVTLKIKSHPRLVFLGLDERGWERFTTQNMLSLETTLLAQAFDLSQSQHHPVTGLVSPSYVLSVEQMDVFNDVMGPEGVRCILGAAGTGKSYLLGAAKEAWEASGYRVHGVTMAGIAAESLEGSSGIESRTLASRCWYWDKGEEHLTSKDILVVDEAGMLGSHQMARILDEVSHAKAKLILVGDTQQLQAIPAGSPFRAIVNQIGCSELREVRRQKVEWQQQATQAFAKGRVSDALASYGQHDNVHEFHTKSLAKQGIIALWNDVRLAHPEQTQILLAYTREDVKDLNEKAREMRHALGELGAERSFKTERGDRRFAENDRIYFLKNDRSLGVMNGTLGTIAGIGHNHLLVRLDDTARREPRTIDVKLELYNHLEHGYAATIHKAQGITVDRTYLLASQYLDAHATYVGMSRHRQSVDLFWSRQEFPSQRALIDTLSRERIKDFSADYLSQGPVGHSRVDAAQQDFARARGIEGFDALNKGIKQPFGRDEHYLEKRAQLDAFKAEFEAKNPEVAKEIQYHLLPKAAKEAIQHEIKMKEQATLEKRLIAELTQSKLNKEQEFRLEQERLWGKDFDRGGHGRGRSR